MRVEYKSTPGGLLFGRVPRGISAEGEPLGDFVRVRPGVDVLHAGGTVFATSNVADFTPHPGPLRTNSDGEVPGWLGRGVYTTTDPVTGDSITFDVGGSLAVAELDPRVDTLEAALPLVESSTPRKASLRINVKDAAFAPSVLYTQGAVGDGVVAPLSGFFATLAAAQAVYPFVTSLTQTRDYAAIQAAINSAVANVAVNLGPAVFVPQGVYRGEDWVLKRHSQSLQVVGLIGEGRRATQLRAATDTGVNTFLVRTENPDSTRPCVVSDIGLKGPNITYAVNAAACQMEGIEIAGRMVLNNVESSHFKFGGRITADHISMYNCVFTRNYGNLRFGGAATPTLTTGDIQFTECDFSSGALASWVISPNAFVAGVQMFGGHMGFSPAAIHAEAGVVATSAGVIAQSVLFYRTSFEGCGNAVIYDVDRLGRWLGFVFRDCNGFNLNNDWQIAAQGRPALFDCGSIDNWKTDNCLFIKNGPLADVMYSSPSLPIARCRWDVDMVDWFDWYVTNGKRLFAQATSSTLEPGRIEGSHTGRLRLAATAVSTGRHCEATIGGFQAQHATVGLPGGCLGFAYANTVAGDLGILLREGGRVNAVSTETIPAHGLVCLDPVDPSKIANAANWPNQPVVGQKTFGGSAVAGTVQIDLRMDDAVLEGVRRAAGDTGLGAPIAVTADRTLQLGDAGRNLDVNSASAVILTIPPNSSVDFPIGTVIEVARIGAGAVTITPGAGVTIPNRIQVAGTSTRTIADQRTSVSLRKRATDEWQLDGNIA